MTEADAIAFLNDTYDILSCQTDLSPNNAHVNSCLSSFVATLKGWQRSGFGAELPDTEDGAPLAERLPRLCAIAECAMEKWWCRKILASSCPGTQALAAFWYLDEYEELCRSELALIGGSREPEHFAFLGSGALPVTALLLALRTPNAAVTCVDCDGEACELAERLVRLLGIGDRVQIAECHAEDYPACPEETVICASLLRAPSLFARLGEKRAGRLIVRDAEGPYRFCYRPAILPGGAYVERSKSTVSPDRINTSRYFELCPAEARLDAFAPRAHMLS
jgi:hypothetical protein